MLAIIIIKLEKVFSNYIFSGNLKDYAIMNYIENTLSNDAFTYLR